MMSPRERGGIMKEEKTAFDFGLRIRQLREERGWSQKELGQRIGVSKQPVFSYEANVQMPPLERAKRIAEIFGVSLDYLVGWESDPSLRLHNLTDRQREALFRFIEAFAPNQLD